MESKSPHRGIDMHRLPIGGDMSMPLVDAAPVRELF